MEIAADILARLKTVVGPSGFSQDPTETALHLTEWRGRWHGRTPLLLKPRTRDEIVRILAICNETGTAVVPQGGNTGLVGAQIPLDGEILLSLKRMNKIRMMDAVDLIAIVEAGTILSDLQAAAEAAGAFFPLSLAAEGSATLGGNVSTNAGGVSVLRYGSTRQLVLGLEIVLADGRVLDLLRTLHKDNTGYDLKQLFIGAEGTLGIITATALKLFPKPRYRETAFVAVPSPTAAVMLLRQLQHACGGLLSAFELIPRIGIELTLTHAPGVRDPLDSRSEWYALIEATGAIAPKEAIQSAVAAAIESGVATNAVMAATESQRSVLWRLRESLSEAQKREGASLKHDVSIPIGAIAEFIRRGCSVVERLAPGSRPVPFGHLGDGNIHFNISSPQNGDSAAFLARRDEISRSIHDLAHSLGGSISAEHGLGVMKRDEIARYKSSIELEVMRELKRTLDPGNILNPGKMLRV